jgi:hypothetical protein
MSLFSSLAILDPTGHPYNCPNFHFLIADGYYIVPVIQTGVIE